MAAEAVSLPGIGIGIPLYEEAAGAMERWRKEDGIAKSAHLHPLSSQRRHAYFQRTDKYSIFEGFCQGAGGYFWLILDKKVPASFRCGAMVPECQGFDRTIFILP